MKRVYTDMAADMFHVGHLNLIKRAKSLGDYLIVGVHSDDDIGQYKRRPIIPQEDRYEMVRSCRYVDEIIEAAPLVMTKDFLLDNKIDFKYLATEFELNFDKNINIALDRATKLCNKFRDNNYTVILNRKRDKVMLELLFIRKDVYAG